MNLVPATSSIFPAKKKIVNRLPYWFKKNIPDKKELANIKSVLSMNINTVCKSAHCPNLGECFKGNKVTFMILGNICTRNCLFCGVEKASLRSLPLDKSELFRIQEAVRELNLEYLVVTSVTRDDLPDGGAAEFVRLVELVRQVNKDIKIELLIPDFRGSLQSLEKIINTDPCVIGHNLETVRSLHGMLKPESNYELSLQVLKNIKLLRPSISTKSSLMLGLGESEADVVGTMKDLKESACDILTLGQYLAPSIKHYPVKKFISIEQFARYRQIALNLGFKAALSGPLVRSSYHAEDIYLRAKYYV